MVTPTLYFEYLVSRRFIQEYTRDDGIISLEVNIPPLCQGMISQVKIGKLLLS
jgi:hypothetical protein